MSNESMTSVPFETDEAMTKLLDELDTYRETGKWRQALKLLDRVDKDEALPVLDPAMYERAVAACARMGKVEVLPGLLNNMMVDNLTPTSATMDFIIQAYLAKEHWGLIVQLASDATAQGVHLSPAAFHAIMEACGQMKDADSTMSIMKQLSEAGMELTTDHYAAAIRAAGMSQKPDTAMALFVQMEEQDGMTADAETFSQLIRSQVMGRQLDQALQSFATVMQRKLPLEEPIYTCTIDSLVTNGRHWQASRLFEQMLDNGEKHPSVFCLGRAMLAYSGANRSQHAWACWNKIVEINEPNPVPMKYNKMLNGLSHAKHTQLAVEVFEHIRKLFQPNQIYQDAYTTAIRAHGRLGNTQTAVDLFDEYIDSCKDGRPVSRHVGIYLALFNALSRDTVREPEINTRDAKRAWQIMSANVPVVLPPAYASLAGVFASSGEMETLEELIEHAERSWGSTAEALQQQEIDEDGEERETIAIFEGDGVELGSDNDVLLFNGVISGLSKARDDQTANIAGYLDIMCERGLPITDSIMRATTDACVRFKNWKLLRRLMMMLDVEELKNPEICLVAAHSSLRYFRNHQRDVERGTAVKSDVPPVIIPLSMYKNAVLTLFRRPPSEDPSVDDSWRMNKAERICKQMLQVHGKNLDGEALSLAISIKSTAGDDDDVGALYETMRALGLKPNSYAQNAAITAFSRQRRTDQVLAIKDELQNTRLADGEIRRVEANVAKSLMRSLALAHEDKALRDAALNLPGCDMDLALHMLIQTNRLTTAVEMFDSSVSSPVFGSLIKRICNSSTYEPVLAAALLLKYVRLNGLSKLGSPNRVLRVTNALIENGDLVDAEQLLQLYLDGSDGISLKQMPPYFQQQTIEMLLFIYGEFGRFDAMHALFSKELLGFPLDVAHYEAAMEYCAQSRDELAGSVASLKMFEMLRTQGFIQPSGYTYLLTLQSCLRLERLEPTSASTAKSTGQIILDDVQEHGFQEGLVNELSTQIATTLDKTQGKMTATSLRNSKKKSDTDDASAIAPVELARLALFCHRHGVPLKGQSIDQLLALHQDLPLPIANELAFVKRSLEEGLGVVTAPGMKRIVKVKKPRVKRVTTQRSVPEPKIDPRRPRSSSYEAAVRAASDARWGVVLEPLDD
ncbi:hypothetical protein BBO99_00000456 [Phytophthora kernoviae]|uniref:Pentacotripeptide-repeat region of PRORP domain-containing protein n=2 Tax=Phytophthora kernoviae TaxID=325452 RepID=A0A3R7JXY9_9STRA|nr:hypothetical protein G195_003391 [Phytophthora kernoviae 00238/432]KAG2510808.1 hypothetical protein JM18_008819 [Phytophthora kernoviae]RLN32194.1 hypothetical protein BBI17_001682 [Phytophthora kernoviae]RLN85537.1 hypothetical protein BBO99_00000456 [Phytophthora kernoviae]